MIVRRVGSNGGDVVRREELIAEAAHTRHALEPGARPSGELHGAAPELLPLGRHLRARGVDAGVAWAPGGSCSASWRTMLSRRARLRRSPRAMSTDVWVKPLMSLCVLTTAASAPAVMASTGRRGQKRR